MLLFVGSALKRDLECYFGIGVGHTKTDYAPDHPKGTGGRMNHSKRREPIVRQATNFPFPPCVVCWLDLLGYGSMIAEAGFNPMQPKATAAIERLRTFHKIVATNSDRYFPTLVMNDGAAAYRDLSLRNRAVTYDFLARAWNLFKQIKLAEANQGFPGVRLVLATGFRIRGRRAGIDRTSGHLSSLMRRFTGGEIDATQAIREAASIRQTFDIVPQLQANFAFTKAYVAESSGSAGGLKGPKFYIDLMLFERPDLPWLKLGSTVEWSHERLSLRGTFAELRDMPKWRHVEGGPIGIRDGLQVAGKLANDPNILRLLRSAKKSASG